MIMTEEECPNTKKKHGQFYFEIKNSHMTLMSMKKKINNDVHFEMRKSTGKDAAGYCWKGERPKRPEPHTAANKQFYEQYFEEHHESVIILINKGKLKENGVRKDVQTNYDKVKSGAISIERLADENAMFVHQYGRVLELAERFRMKTIYRHPKNPPYDIDTTCEWFYGDTGRGKSHNLFILSVEAKFGVYSPELCYTWNLNEKFQNYELQKCVIINEYKGPKHIEYSTLLEMIDKWPYFQQGRKGKDAVPFVAEHIIISSIFHPTDIEWNLSSKDKLDQLLNRITVTKIEGEDRRLKKVG
jgi:hypothetical protein